MWHSAQGLKVHFCWTAPKLESLQARQRWHNVHSRIQIVVVTIVNARELKPGQIGQGCKACWGWYPSACQRLEQLELRQAIQLLRPVNWHSMRMKLCNACVLQCGQGLAYCAQPPTCQAAPDCCGTKPSLW